MPKITKPMLASNFELEKASWPYIATPKIDGIRFLMVDGQAVSRSFKPIRNKYVQKLLSEHLPNGIDGELTCGDTFQSSTSGIMSINGEPDFKVWVFDYVDEAQSAIDPFSTRIQTASMLSKRSRRFFSFALSVLTGKLVENIEELSDFEELCLSRGYEGVMLRDPNGTYKFGRATARENLLLKVKRFMDAEGELIGVEEAQRNDNEAEKDAFGRTKRSSSIAGMVGKDTTGSLILRLANGDITKCGTGLNDELRKLIWENQSEYIGRLVKFKYLDHGVKTLPRHPVFLGFRSEDDIS